MSEGDKKDYVGATMPDKSIRIEGPLGSKEADERATEIIEKEGHPVSRTTADNTGQAILKIASTEINYDKSKGDTSS